MSGRRNRIGDAPPIDHQIPESSSSKEPGVHVENFDDYSRVQPSFEIILHGRK